MLDQFTAKTHLGRWRDGWTVLLSPYPPQSTSILALDDLPHDFDRAAGHAERTILGSIGRELVHQQTEGRCRRARQHHRGTLHAYPLRISGKVGLELIAGDGLEIRPGPLAINEEIMRFRYCLQSGDDTVLQVGIGICAAQCL